MGLACSFRPGSFSFSRYSEHLSEKQKEKIILAGG